LVNHFYQNGTVHAAPLKAVEVGADGILRLKWWSGNDKIKATPVATKLVGAGTNDAASLRLFDQKLDLGRAHVIEGVISDVLPQAKGEGKYGLFFDQGNGTGHCLLFASDAVRFGEIKVDGSGLKVLQTSSRDMDFGSSLSFRLVIQGDMMELYVNDYLTNLKRVRCNGRIGFMVDDRQGAFKDISVWQSK
jgi:hypothetical protein